MTREAKITRRTKETNITASIVLEGTGRNTVKCDDHFLRHMLETFSKYSSFDLQYEGTGDDQHHLVEDSAIVSDQQ